MTMKRLLPPVACGLLAVGCMGINTNTRPAAPKQAEQLYAATPSADEIIGYLNRNAAQVNSLECRSVDMDISADGQSVGVTGDLHCQKPRNFRLRANKPVVHSQAADFGSNDREFWYWISEDKPPDLYHCSYNDLSRGNVRLPFPLHPDWVLEALGMSAPPPPGPPDQEQARGRVLEVRKSADNRYLNLYEQTTSLQGQPVTKVTMLNNFRATGTTPQVVGHYLYDSRTQQIICQATITKVQYDATSGAMVPQKVELKWPAMKLSLALTLDKVVVNNPELASNQKLFARPHWPHVRDVDLARGAPITTPTGVQRAGAFANR
jgi:hypothetical protein